MAVLELDKEQILHLALQLKPEEQKEIAQKLLNLGTETVRRRVPGQDKGKVWIAPDFNAPLPKEIEDTFYE